MQDAWSFWNMCPREIKGRINAYHAGKAERIENMDKLSWMIGLYSGKAYHDPKNYPRNPEIIKKASVYKEAPEMDEQDLKDRLLIFAEINNSTKGV